MAFAKTKTILALDRYAKIMNINPVWFNSAKPASTTFQPKSAQNQYWFQYTWQDSGLISREDLAIEIARAEQDIADYLGYWPGPKFFYEQVPYPQPNRPTSNRVGYDLNWRDRILQLRYGKTIEIGKREATLLGTATTGAGTLTYSDTQSKGFYDLATIAIPTTETDVCGIAVFFSSKSAAEEYEIRPVISKAISGGTLTITIKAWQMIDLDLWEAYPDQGEDIVVEIDGTGTNLVTSVEVYKIDVDPSEGLTINWDCSCTSICTCGSTSHVACPKIISPNNGSVRATIADYSDGYWTVASWPVAREPNYVDAYYYSGDYMFDNNGCKTMTYQLEKIVAELATARMNCMIEHDINIWRYMKKLQADTLLSVPDGDSFFVTDDIQNSPFGTRVGEVRAYFMLKNKRDKKPRLAGVM